MFGSVLCAAENCYILHCRL